MPIEAGFEATLAENHSRGKLSDTRFILGDDLIILRDLPVSGRRTQTANSSQTGNHLSPV